MRRMLIDTLESKPSRLVTFPEGELLNLRIAEPNDANVGPTGILGYGFRPRSYQKLNLEINGSGDFVENHLDAGATFTFKPNDLLDENGDSILDGTVQRLGSDNFWEPRVSQNILKPDHSYAYDYINTSLKMVQLKKWRDVNADYGYIGLSVYCSRYIADDTLKIYIRRLEERRFDGTSCGYSWESVSTTGLTGLTSTVDPYADLTELADGSIVLAISHKDGANTTIAFFKSFDCGATWESVEEVVSTSVTVESRVTLDTVGGRVVTTFLYASGVNFYIKSSYSDDGGWTWTNPTTAIYVASANPTSWSLDSVMSFAGKLYVCYLRAVGGSNISYAVTTTDGSSWSGGVLDANTDYESFSLIQHPSGGWMIYGIISGELNWSRKDDDDPIDIPWYLTGSYFKTMTVNMHDAGGYDATDVCARFFAYNGFVELGVIEFDSHSGTDYTMPLFMRCGMWNGINFNLLPSFDFFAQGYPSTSDTHPNLDIFTRAGAAAGSFDLDSDDGFPAFKLVTAASTIEYAAIINTSSYDTGSVIRFSAKMVSGDFFSLSGLHNSAASNKEVAWVIRFLSTNIIIYDVVAGVTLTSIGLTNWRCDEWNDFIVAIKEDTIEIYRAPRSHFNEFLHYELVASEQLQEDPNSATLDRISWGAVNAGPSGDPTSTVLWREVQIWSDSDQGVVGWDFDDDLLGRKCILSREQGIMQGFGVRFIGAYAVEDDAWDLEVGAVYDPRNILTHSPTEQWRETEQSAASPERIFEWYMGNDFAGNEINTLGNGVALFGKNFLNFKLEILSKALAATTVIDTSVDHKGYICLRKVYKEKVGVTAYNRIFENIITLETEVYPANALATDMIPGQYASNEYRNYYAEIIDGTAQGFVYRILDNDANSLVLEADVEPEMLDGDDTIAIFSDRVFFELDDTRIGVQNAYASFYGWRLTIPTTKTSQTENQLRLGKILLGRWVALKDDEWAMNMNTVSGLQVQEGFGGRKATRRLKQERRVLGMSYTGLNDIGAGVNAVTALAKVMKFGETPVAYIDDNTLLSSKIGNCEPILMRLSGDVNQRRVVYEKEDFIFDTTPTTKSMQRNVFDADMTFEEVL